MKGTGRLKRDSSAWGQGRRRDMTRCTGGRAGSRPRRGGRPRAGRVQRRVQHPAGRQLGNQHQPGDQRRPGDQQRHQRREHPGHAAGQRDPAAERVGGLHAQQRRSRPGRPDRRRQRGDPHHHPGRGPAGRGSPRAHRYVQPVPGRGPERAAGRQPGRAPAGPGRVPEVRQLHAGQRGPQLPLPRPGTQTNFNGTGVDPNSPSVEKANELCGKKIGAPAWWINGTDTPGEIEVHTAGMNPNATPPACFFAKK